MQAFAVVAQTLGGINPEDEEAVTSFYDGKFQKYRAATRQIISEFLIGQTGMPTSDALRALENAVHAEELNQQRVRGLPNRNGPATTRAKSVVGVFHDGILDLSDVDFLIRPDRQEEAKAVAKTGIAQATIKTASTNTKTGRFRRAKSSPAPKFRTTS